VLALLLPASEVGPSVFVLLVIFLPASEIGLGLLVLFLVLLTASEIAAVRFAFHRAPSACR
jgi:hypothetical protein